MTRPAGPLEKQVAYRVGKLYAGVGCSVYSTQQTRPSRQAIGLPDFWVMHPRLGGFWHEVKREGGKQSPGQVDFQQRCAAAKVDYVLGGVDEAQDYLRRRGLLQSEAVKQQLAATRLGAGFYPDGPPGLGVGG